MKQNNRPKGKIIYQAFFSILLIALLSISVVGYAANAMTKMRGDVAEEVKNKALAYAIRFDDELSDAMFCAGIISELVKSGKTDLTTEMQAIIAQDRVDHLFLIDDKGMAVDENGKSIDLSTAEFWRGRNLNQEKQILSHINEAGNQYLMCVVRTSDPAGNRYYSVSAYFIGRFVSSIKKNEFDSLGAFIITDLWGNLIASNSVKSAFCEQSNIWMPFQGTSTEANRLKSVMRENGTGIASLSIGNEARRVVVTPIGNKNLSLVVAVNEKYMEHRFTKLSGELRKLGTVVLTMLVCYVLIQGTLGAIFRNKEDRVKKALEEKADTDLLTGLNNKLATERKIKEYMEENPDTQCMMMLFDIDKFKKINDTKGHAFGDEVLKTLGETISGQFRVTDIIGRIGGDEFMIFLKDIPSEEIAKREAQKLIYFFKDFKAGGYVKYSATASIGVAMFPSEANTFEGLYKAADEALYRSKEGGRNQLNFYNREWGTIKP